MSREFKRDMERQKRRAEQEAGVAAEPVAGDRKTKRVGTRQFVREVRGEMKRVVWPSRKEVASYSVVVLVAVALVGLFIFGLDQMFGDFALRIFS